MTIFLLTNTRTFQNLNNLITVVAVAADASSANIVYSQVMRGVPSDGVFSVTPTGGVNVVGNLDREAESTYDVQIQVRAIIACDI